MSTQRPLYLCLLAATLTCSLAFADDIPTISVYASPAPNAYGSPSWGGYVSNAINALQNGLSSVGNPATDPTAYYQVTNGTAYSNIVTSFPSWNGSADPTGAFAGELGNRLHFGVDIQGNGTLISLSELSFNMSSSDPGNTFGFTGDFSTDDYTATRVGIIFGTGNNPNTYINSGSGTQQVDEIDYVGVGNAIGNTDLGVNCPGSDQSTLDCVAGLYAALTPFTISTEYSLAYAEGHVATGSASVDFAPEPGTVSMLGLGIAALGCLAWRRRSRISAV
jgi:hypothetical protein